MWLGGRALSWHVQALGLIPGNQMLCIPFLALEIQGKFRNVASWTRQTVPRGRGQAQVESVSHLTALCLSQLEGGTGHSPI